MGGVFSALGGVSILLGIGWVVFIFASGQQPAMALVASSVPGIGLTISGLFMLAIGEALEHLRRIERHSKSSSEAMSALMKRASERAGS